MFESATLSFFIVLNVSYFISYQMLAVSPIEGISDFKNCARKNSNEGAGKKRDGRRGMFVNAHSSSFLSINFVIFSINIDADCNPNELKRYVA